MTQTGRGTLSPRDLTLFRTKFIFFVPMPNGAAPIVVCDPAKAFQMLAEHPKLANDGTVDRIVMYLCTVCTNAAVQSKGSVFLHIVTADKRPRMDYRTQMWDMISHALPYKISRAVVGQSYREGAEALLEFLRVQMATLTGYHTRMPVHEAYGNSQQETISQMVKVGGVRREMIPTSLGGSFHLDAAFEEFTRMRLSLEDIMGPGTLGATMMMPVPTAAPQELVVHTASKRMPLQKRKRATPDSNINETNEGDTAEAQRDRNALYARRSYYRRQMRRVELLEQVRTCHERNEVARQEGQRLEVLLNQANFVVGLVEQNRALNPVGFSSR
mmetsp:Transcript_24259/g.46185  ORF Transcript_24259/g.46185 Transcript_24259/m.46185 type:complete len:329 (+) Transcript_24259:592-1578(+)